MKAQASAEALMAFALGLVLLGIALGAVNSIRESHAKAAHSALLSRAADDVAEYADEICVMGEGNSRMAPLPSFPISFSYSNNSLLLSSGGAYAERETICPIEVKAENISEKAYLWHDDFPALPGQKPKIILDAKPP
jgi:hypothetical protein